MATINTLRTGTMLTHALDIKHSRFITTLARVDSARQARDLIDAVKAEHPQARHNCSAYLINEDGLNPMQHSSDDGEPAGTAGTPMLDALRMADVWNVCAVVTRYFGGILLGGGGLIRAYSSSVSQALPLAPRAHLRDVDILSAHLPLSTAGRIEAELRAAGAWILNVTWGSDVTIEIGAEPGQRDTFDALLAAATQGVTHFQILGASRIEVDGPAPAL